MSCGWTPCFLNEQNDQGAFGERADRMEADQKPSSVFRILFQEWVALSEQNWVIFGERRRFGQVVAFIAAPGHARAAARSRLTDHGSGHHSWARVHSSAAPAFVRSTRRFRHLARLDRRVGSHRHRGRPVCHRRAALGVVRHVGARAGVWSGPGSFGRPYNHRLHQTAPRAFFPISPW